MDQPTSSKKTKEWFNIDESKNTYVYVNGLPIDTTEEDFITLMKKYGIIAKKPVPGNPFNIKMYKNKDGSFKGDALCCYARVESVELALINLDGYLFDEKHTLHCERAKFQMKGEYDASKKPRPLDKKAKLKQKKKLEGLLSWDSKLGKEVRQKKVVLKHMFVPDELLEDATLILDIKQDVEDKCTEIACEPKKVDIYDSHPDGVVTVTFDNSEQAESCVQALNNQFYAGRTIKAELWDGKTKYKVKETDEESQMRLERWHKDIQDGPAPEKKLDATVETYKTEGDQSDG